MSNIGCKGTVVDCLTGAPDCTAPDPLDPLKTVCIKKTKVVTPVPDNRKKKKEEKKVTPKTECTSDYGSPLSNSQFGEDLKTTAGLKLFKEFLKKYYSENVDKYGGSALLDSATINDCILIKLFNSSEAKKNNRIIGVYVYPDWKTFTGGDVTSKTTEEFQSWLGSGTSSDKEEFIPTTNDWQKLIDNGQISAKGKKITFDNKPVMLFKFKIKDGDTTGGSTSILTFDENELDGDNLSLTKLLKNITYSISTFDSGYPEIFYAFYTFPVKNEDTETNEKYPLKVKRYVLTKGKDVNGVERLEAPESLMVYRGLKAPKKEIKINESFIKNFILEKIKEKNDPSYYPVVTEITTGIGGDDEDEESGNLGDGGNKEDNDPFAILSNPQLENREARKNFIESKTPIIQDLINKGARSNYFMNWNDLVVSAGATTKLKLPKPDNTGAELTKANAFQIAEPAQSDMAQYKSEPFYSLLKINGDATKNKATIFTPISVTEKQKYITASSDPKRCRAYLIDYLRVAIKQESVGNEFEDWKKTREICDCNANGGFRNFKIRGKSEESGKEKWRKDRLKIKTGKSEFMTTTKTSSYNPDTGKWEESKVVNDLDATSPFLPVFNKNLNWNEIVSLLKGETYKSKDGQQRTIDEDMIITGFDGPGSICLNDKWRLKYQYPEESTVQKESLDNRIENKLSEVIKNKNKKDNLVENVLKKLLKR